MNNDSLVAAFLNKSWISPPFRDVLDVLDVLDACQIPPDAE